MGDYTLTVVAIGYCTLPYSPLPKKEGDKKQLHGSGGSCVVSPTFLTFLW